MTTKRQTNDNKNQTNAAVESIWKKASTGIFQGGARNVGT